MSNGSPAVAAAASSSTGGGIAFLRRQFELRVDPLYETPMKPMVRKRPVSFIDPKAIKTTAVEPEHVQPKPRDATSLSELAASDPGHGPSNSASSFSSSSSSSSSASSSLSKTTVDAATGVDRASPKDAKDRQMEEIQEIRGEGASNDITSHSHDLDLTPTPQLHQSDVNTAKGTNESSMELREVETNDKYETKDTSSENDGLYKTNSEFNLESTSTCNPPEMESLNGVNKSGMKSGKDAQHAEYYADRRLPEETLPPAQTSSNSKTYLSSSNATPKKTWMPVTRSMENLCSNSAGGTPTKESSNFCEKKPNDVLLSAKAKAADAAVTTSQSLDRSTSLATKVKPPVRAKKPPPPPVPKKNVKFAVVPNSHRTVVVDDAKKEDSNPSTKMSTEEGNSLNHSSEETIESEEGGDQGQPSVLRRSATTSTKVTRPTSFFPPMQQQSPAVRRAVESAVEYDRYKSLPTLSQGESPVCNRKDTLFPSNRQRLRPQVLAAESGHVGGSGALTPEFYQRSSIGDFQQLLASPMSLGNRTPPGIDSVIATPEERLADRQPSSVSSNCPLPTPIDSDTSHSTRMRTTDTLLPPPSSNLKTFNIASAAEQQVSGSNQFSEMSDADSFLDDTFEFLSCDAQPMEDESTIISPLKLWTDTWCKSSTKNNTEITLRPSTTDAKINNNQKSIDISTKDDSNDQDREEKSRLKTTAKKEEDKQRTTVGKQDLQRRASSGIGVDRKATENAKDVEQPKLFGVVLRNNSISSLARRSSFVSAIPSTSSTNASSSSSSSAAAAAATSVRDRRSTAIVRTPSDTRSLSRLSSLTTLTILPSNRPAAKVPGKYIGGKPSIILDRTSSVVQKDKKTDIETELDAIDKAFDFLGLDDSGA